jgi:hypothetical protein
MHIATLEHKTVHASARHKCRNTPHFTRPEDGNTNMQQPENNRAPSAEVGRGGAYFPFSRFDGR